MIIDPNSPSWREQMEADIRQAIISSGGVLPIQTNPSWKARIEELVKIFTYLVVPANGSITNLQIAANAAIAWSKISKVGALPGDVGAATAAQGAKADSALQAASWASPGEIGATVANTGKFTTIGIGSTAKETRSAAVPSSPSVGDIWLELDGSNYPKYGWHWRWNGTYWLSPDQTVDFSQSNVASGNYYYLHANPAFNYFFKTLNISSFATVLQTAANFFTFAVNRSASNNANTVITSTTTNGNATAAWVRKNISVNVHVNTSVTDANVFSLNTAMTGTAGDLYVAIQAVYNLARL